MHGKTNYIHQLIKATQLQTLKNLDMKNEDSKTEPPCTIHGFVGSALPPREINHGDVWGHGKDWFTFYCPNEQCNRQVSGERECPHCGQKIDWGS